MRDRRSDSSRKDAPSGEPRRSGDSEICVSVWAATDTGRVRSRNQDSFLVRLLPPYPTGLDAEVTRIDPTTPSAPGIRAAVGGGGLLVLVADGMGGAPAGDLASRLAVRVISERMEASGAERDPSGIGVEQATASPTLGTDLRTRRFGASIQAAHDHIRTHQRNHPEHRGMGTTLTGLLLTDEGVVVAQVGDSRAYRLRDGQLTRLTRDQTVAQQKVDSGHLSEAEARHSPESHILLQAVGSGPSPRVAFSTASSRPDDLFVLCSDGLTGVVEDAEIGRILALHEDLHDAGARLIDEANRRGSPDNVTVALLAVASS